MSDEGDCRIAPATPGLLIISRDYVNIEEGNKSDNVLLCGYI